MNQDTDLTKNIIVLIVTSILFLSLNSILCRTALVNNSIDPYSFTFFRLFFATVMLIGLYYYKYKKVHLNIKENWITSFMLFIYAIAFSYAYVSIDAGFGTLLLFGVVQLVMIGSSLILKESLSFLKVIGVVISLFGLVYMLYPNDDFELSLFHTFLMILSGISWAIYSVLGKKSLDAFSNTTDNFIKATFFIGMFYIVFPIENIYITGEGLFLAIISGSITSALGYIIWYEVLPNIKIVTASVIQLFVPIVAIFLSIVFLDEILTFNLLVSALIIIVGILITIFSKSTIKG